MKKHLFFVEDVNWEKYKDTLSKNRNFYTEKEAQDYIENHPRPEDLITAIDEGYSKMKKEQSEKKQELLIAHIKVLELISLENNPKAMTKVLKMSKIKFDTEIIENLKFQGLIKKKDKENWELTNKGEGVLRHQLEKKK